MDKKSSIWSLQFSTAALVLIPVAVGINYIGKLFAEVLKLPLWLDSIGTFLASMLAGPIIGAISGLINNIIYGLTADPMAFIYGLTSIGLGLAIGIMARKGFIKNFKGALCGGLVAGLVSVIISTPLNLLLYAGQTGNVWGDATFAAVLNATNMIALSSFCDEIITDLPDKIICVLIAFVLYRSMPKNLLQLYTSDSKIEKL